MRVLVEYPVDWITGYLCYGHKEGEIELTEEEYAEFKKNPTVWLKSHEELITEFDLKVDSIEVDDYDNDIQDVAYTIM